MLRIMSAVVVVALKIAFPQLYPMIFVIHITILLKIRNFIISNQTVLPLFIFYLSLRTFKQNTSKKKAPKPTYLPSKFLVEAAKREKQGATGTQRWRQSIEGKYIFVSYYGIHLGNCGGWLNLLVKKVCHGLAVIT